MVQTHPLQRWPQAIGLGGLALAALLTFGCSPNPSATSDTSSYEAQLAQHLAATGGVMYGAYWCPHCADQKAMFKESAEQLPYVECAADGDNPQPELCQQKGIQGYPTWEIDGQLYPGVRSLDELADLSGFSASQ
ncbi:protein disulfide isomerase family protein [Nodosilinea sp. AN01ver1]|uniref:protein disulfide isomerase family protein n=1 Tax=Nodosilinea sp. AN01ver1 TaxID=3423362 RepID=UPI003D3139D1